MSLSFLRRFLRPTAAVSSVLLAASVSAAESSSPVAPAKVPAVVNSLGMRFVPVPGTHVLFSIWETRVQDWQAAGRPYAAPAYPQQPDHPAVNVSLEDARAFCAWLSKKEGRTYRLPTDHEWSCAVGIGELEDPRREPAAKNFQLRNIFPWGQQGLNDPVPATAGNFAGAELDRVKREDLERILYVGFTRKSGANDGFPFTAPVGSFPANALGLHDLGGNVWEWCDSRYASGQPHYVMRGGSWFNDHRVHLFSSFRRYYPPETSGHTFGFRVVLER